VAGLELDVTCALRDFALDVALSVAPGETVAVVGPSGAGKTTLLRAVAGLVRPAEGRVACAGDVWLDTAAGVDRAPEERRVGYLFQEHALFPHLRAWQNVAYPLRELPRRERRAQALALLDRFGVAPRADARPAELSGGERQRVALARALARRPDALLLDEPLSSLDARTRASAVRELARALREAAVPALLVTHDFAEAAQLGDRVGVIDRGRIVQEGTASELAAAPGSAFVADFAGAVVLTGVARQGPDGLTHVALDGGGSATSTDAATGPVALSVYPWEIAIEPPEAVHETSASNRVAARVVTVTRVGNRVRLGLDGPQPLSAEVTAASVERLGIAPGDAVAATWKAAASRLLPR
jgi:molybdate transport system ATP-binding protein